VTRLELFGMWLLVVLFTPVLLIAMLIQALFGSEARAKSMAIAQDECGSSLFGNPPTETISTATGNALVEGKRWAKLVAPFIDFIFGKGHCLANASIPPEGSP